MDDISIRLVTEDKAFTSGIEKAIANVQKLEEAEESRNVAIKKNMTEAVQATDKYNQGLGTSQKQLKDAAKEQRELTDEVKNSIRNYKIFGVSINDIDAAFKKAAASSKLLARGIGTGTKALRVFKLALVSTGIGALVVAVGALVAKFTSTQRGIDKVSQVMSGLGAVVDVIIDRLSSLGTTIIDVFNKPGQTLKRFGDFFQRFVSDPIGTSTELFNDAKDAVNGLVQEIEEESKAAVRLERRNQALRDSRRDLNIETAKSRALIKQLNKDAEDTTKTTEEREAAAKRAIGIEQALLQQRIKNAEEELNIIKERNALSESLAGDLDAQAEAEIKIAELRTESLELQTTLQNKLNTITAEGARKALALQQAYDDLFGSLQTRLLDSIAENGTPIEQLNRQFQKDIDELEADRSRLLQLADELGLDTQKINNAFNAFKSQIIIAAQENARELRGAEDVNPIEAIFQQDRKLDIEVPEIEIQPKNIFEAADKFKKDLVDAMGLTPEDAKVLEQSLKNTLNTLVGVYTAGIDQRIEANRTLRQDLANQTTALEEQLEREKQFKDQGLANDVERLEKALATQNDLEAKAVEEAEELQRKRARIELLQNLASQASNLSTAAAKIFNSTAGIPFVGIALAIGAIASMYASFKSFKAQANADIRLFTGAQRIGDYFGQPAPGGASDIPGRGDGYRIEGTNVIIGGDEFISTERAASDHYKFLNDLNRNPNKYKGVDIQSAVSMSKSMSNIGKQSRRLSAAETARVERRIEEAIYKAGYLTVQAIKDRPHYITDGEKQVKIQGTRREKRPF